MAGTNRKAVKEHGFKSEVRALREEFNDLVGITGDLERLRQAIFYGMRDGVLPNQATGVGLSVDANAQDFETDNAAFIRHKGVVFSLAAVGAFDWSASGTCAGDTVAQGKAGAFWVFGKTAGGLDVEDAAGNQSHDSEIEALAQYSKATNTLPPAAGDVPVGVITVVEGGSGVWTAGDDSISGETETFYDLLGWPAVESPCASLAIGGTASAVTYGAVTVRLGSGTRVAATGKANVALTGSNVADKKVGAWLLYVLADDSEYFMQLGAAYDSLTEAREAVAAHNVNPLLAHVATVYVENKSGATFTTATTALNASGITTTLVIEQAPTAGVDNESDMAVSTVNA